MQGGKKTKFYCLGDLEPLVCNDMKTSRKSQCTHIIILPKFLKDIP